ncbi:MAG TPA: glycosyltransferase family 2 protein [Candidatus Nitrosopolaris rasttigaisensis]|nr:glycosyltransferase family 2 protein [Candidatus Nitrosopolaris rasttigaisensis]
MKREKITVLIPCHNEEQGIAKVMDSIPYHTLDKHGFEAKVIVIDNNSSDRTREIAESKGAHVIFESAKGKGKAMRKGFNCIDSDTAYVVMLDGDNTYDAGEMLRLIEPITSGFCDVVVGSRLGGKVTKNAFKAQNRLANWIYTFLVRTSYNANITDVLSGYFAWRRDVIVEMRDHLKSDGFSIEMEMISKLVKLNYSIYSVPITYSTREGETKIESIKDGLKILYTFYRNLFWSPPPKESVGKKNNDQQIAFNISALKKPVVMSDSGDLLNTVGERETTGLRS